MTKKTAIKTLDDLIRITGDEYEKIEKEAAALSKAGGLAPYVAPRATRAVWEEIRAKRASIDTLSVKTLVNEDGLDSVIVPADILKRLVEHVQNLEIAVKKMTTSVLAPPTISPLISGEAWEKLFPSYLLGGEETPVPVKRKAKKLKLPEPF